MLKTDLMDGGCRCIVALTGKGGGFAFALDDLLVAEFYRKLFADLEVPDIHASINTKPFDLDDEQPLAENVFHRTCDRE